MARMTRSRRQQQQQQRQVAASAAGLNTAYSAARYPTEQTGSSAGRERLM